MEKLTLQQHAIDMRDALATVIIRATPIPGKKGSFELPAEAIEGAKAASEAYLADGFPGSIFPVIAADGSVAE